MHRFIIILVFPLLLMACTQKERTPKNQGRVLDIEGSLSVFKKGKKVTSFDVAIADTETERNTGLMDVRVLPDHQGMLFIFEESKPLTFWMANTPLSLDMLFVNEDMKIVRIHRATQPFSEERYGSDLPARYVLELIAGTAVNFDIQEGDSVSVNLNKPL